VVGRQGQQHEAELAGLRQVQAGAQRDAGGGAEGLGQRRHQRQLEQHRQQRQQQHQRPLAQRLRGVEDHADGDEEEPEQHVVEGPDVGLDLMLEFGLGDQHAGNEGAEREGEAGMLGQPGEAERDQQQVEHEQLLALASRHERQPPAHHALAADQQHREQRRRLQAGEPQLARQFGRRRAERRDQHQQRHHGQVLEQQHAHHAAAVLGLELEPLGEHLDDDRRAAHRQRAAERDGALPAELPRTGVAHAEPGEGGAEQEVADHGRQHGQRDLAEAEAEDEPAHALQLGQVELEPDDEHQEHDAEFAQVAHAGRVGGERHRVRADDDADREIADHRRQLEGAAEDHAGHRGDEIQQHQFQRDGHAARVVGEASRSRARA
jgi:hypothetical protein